MIDLGVSVAPEMSLAITTIADHEGRTKADLVREVLQNLIDRKIADAHASRKLLDKLEGKGIPTGSEPAQDRKAAEK